ncbi:MAG: amidase family protein, partial [Halomonas sp.]
MTTVLTIASLHAAYRHGELTPRVLVDQLLEQAAAHGHDPAWITRLDRDQLEPYLARLEGESPDSLPLYGIPFAIKDNIDLAGVPTTAGCPAFAYIPEQSAFVVQRLIDAGALPLGKTNLDQFATGLVGERAPAEYGVPANAFDAAYIPGGSSSGSAVVTAAGQVSFALGTDTAGSGRVPACFHNLFGV